MAEVNIFNTANVYAIDKYSKHPHICRDDNDDYWAVFRDTSDQLVVYKSTDDGITWVLKKTLTNSDWTGSPLPTNAFAIINLSGQDKVYLFISSGSSLVSCYGWIFNVTADTNIKDLDADTITSTATYEYQIAWDAFNSRLLVYAFKSNVQGEGRYGKILLDGTLEYNSYSANDGAPLSYYIDSSGYGYTVGESITYERIILNKKKNNIGFYNADLDTVNIALTKADLLFVNVVTDSAGHPVVGYADANAGVPRLVITKRDSGNLATELVATSINIVSGVNPDSCFMTVDGDDNVYFIFTDGSDKEAYYIMYNGTSWGSEIKFSSDNDGKLVMPEIKPPITATKILTVYQATV